MYITYETHSKSFKKIRLAFAIKQSAYSVDKIKDVYASQLDFDDLIDLSEVMYTSLYDEGKKTIKASVINEFLVDYLLPVLKEHSVTHIVITDAAYIKKIAKLKKATDALATFVDCKLDGFEGIQAMYCPSYKASYFSDEIAKQISLCLQEVSKFLKNDGNYLGQEQYKYNIIEPNIRDVKETLKKLLTYDELTCDIEAFGLKHYEAGLGLIGFGTDVNEGYTIAVQHTPNNTHLPKNNKYVLAVKQLLKEFFELYSGTLIFHNAKYDIKVLTYELYMTDILDRVGMVQGINTLTKSFEDTRLIAYVSLNSCDKILYSLKALSFEKMGNYAEDVKDISSVNHRVLSEYCIKDCVATRYLYDKYTQIMRDEEQEDIYKRFLDVAVSLIEIELVGIPVNLEKAKQVKDTFDKQIFTLEEDISNHESVHTYCLAKNNKEFNYKSSKQLSELLYTFNKLEIPHKTDTGEPSTNAEALDCLVVSKKTDESLKELIQKIQKAKMLDKLISTYMVHILDAYPAKDGWHYLFGTFNLGGTKSGRLSASEPNLQTIPRKTKEGKLVKSCFQANVGYATIDISKMLSYGSINKDDKELIKQIIKLTTRTKDKNVLLVRPQKIAQFKEILRQLKIAKDLINIQAIKINKGELLCTIDFAALEDRINALVTRDRNKMKVYTGDKQFKITLSDNSEMILKAGEKVSYKGNVYEAEELVQKLKESNNE